MYTQRAPEPQYVHQYPTPPNAVSPSAYVRPAESYAGFAPQDRPVASIEQDNNTYNPQGVVRPTTPENERSLKRRRYENITTGRAVDENHQPAYPTGSSMRYKEPLGPAYAAGVDFVDLTSPVRQTLRDYAIAPCTNGQYHSQLQHGLNSSTAQARPPPQHLSRTAQYPDPEPYDPLHPSLLPAEQTRATRNFEPPALNEPRRVYVQASAAYSPYEQPPAGRYYQVPPVSQPARPPANHVQYVQQQQEPSYSHHSPLPVHGAPAPVQQAPTFAQYPVALPNSAHHRIPGERPRPSQLPTDGAVAPTQYYYPT